MEIDLEKEYNNLKKKYPKLPDFNEINENLELSVFESRIANTSLFARYLRKVVGSYIENFCAFLTNIMHPNPNFLIGVNESKFFDDKDREKISEVVKENMTLVRWASSITIIYKEENEIDAIIKLHEQMKKNKETLKDIFVKLKEGWESYQEKTESKEYFG